MNLKVIFGLLIVSLAIFLIGFGGFKLTQKEVAGIQVITGDKEAVVFLDGHYLDSTPLVEQKLKPKTYILRIEPKDPNLVPYETEVNLHPGTLTVVTWHPEASIEKSGGVIYEMQQIQNNKTEVYFQSIPDRAIIKLDDREADFAPFSVTDLQPGEHNYEASLPSYETQQNSLNVKKGYRINVLIKLAKTEPEADQPKPNASIQPTPTSEPASQSAQTSLTVTILPTGLYQAGRQVLRVREKPTQASKQVGLVVVGQVYPYLQQEDNWYQIKFDQDQVGWVSGRYVKQNP